MYLTKIRINRYGFSKGKSLYCMKINKIKL